LKLVMNKRSAHSTKEQGGVKDLFTVASALVDLSANKSEDGNEQGIDNYHDIDGGGKNTKFPMKLMQVLSSGTHQFEEIMSWTHDGLCFTVHSPKKLEAIILPAVFDTQAKYSSFQRKLYRWGFLKKYHHADDHTYFHKSFQRGKPELCNNTLTRPFRQKRKCRHDLSTKKQSNPVAPVPESATSTTKKSMSLFDQKQDYHRIRRMMFDQQQQEARMRNLSILPQAKRSKEVGYSPRTPSHHYFENDGAATNMSLIADELLLNARPVTVTPEVSPSSVSDCSSIFLDHVIQLRKNAEQNMSHVLDPDRLVPPPPVPVGIPTLGNNLDRLIMLRQFSGVASSNSYSPKSGLELSLANHGEHFYHTPLLPSRSRSRSMSHKEIISSAMNDLVARQSIFERNK
jgi:hypothetical protein